MAGKRKGSAQSKREKVKPELVHEDGYWWIISGTKRLNVGRNEKYAQRLLDEGLLPK